MRIEKNQNPQGTLNTGKICKSQVEIDGNGGPEKCLAPNHQNSGNWKECSVKDAKSKYEINNGGGDPE